LLEPDEGAKVKTRLASRFAKGSLMAVLILPFVSGCDSGGVDVAAIVSVAIDATLSILSIVGVI